MRQIENEEAKEKIIGREVVNLIDADWCDDQYDDDDDEYGH